MCSLSLTGFEASSYAAETFVLHGIATHRRSRVQHYICVYEAWACGVGGPAGGNTRSGRQCAAMSLGGICVVKCLISIGCLRLLFLTEGRAITRMYRHMRVFPLLHCCFRLHIAGDLCHLCGTHILNGFMLWHTPSGTPCALAQSMVGTCQGATCIAPVCMAWHTYSSYLFLDM